MVVFRAHTFLFLGCYKGHSARNPDKGQLNGPLCL
jgi:hypothetical protein